MNPVATARRTWRKSRIRVAIPDSIGNNYLLAIRAGNQSEQLTLNPTEVTTPMISRRSSRPVASQSDASAPKSSMLRVAAMSVALLTLCFAIIACSSSPVPTPVVIEVEKLVEVEKPVIVEKQVIVEVEVEKPSAEPNTLTVYSGTQPVSRRSYFGGVRATDGHPGRGSLRQHWRDGRDLARRG